MSRRQSREEAFKTLFEMSFQGPQCISDILDYYYKTKADERVDKDYFESVVLGVCSRLEELDDIISKFSIGWKKNRISKVSLVVLWLSIYEIIYRDDIPNSVSANEAVELAKTYEGPESGAFVNGILGSFLKSLENLNRRIFSWVNYKSCPILVKKWSGN